MSNAVVDPFQNWDWLVAALVAFGIAWLIQSLRSKARGDIPKDQHTQILDTLEEEKAKSVRLEERTMNLETNISAANAELESSREETTQLNRKLAAADERSEYLEERISEQKEELERIHKKLTTEFENLANRILDEKSKKFVLQNKESLDKLLTPLGEKIVSFRERVEKTREEDLKDRASLAEQIKAMSQLNQKMSEEARNLTTALKGQSKAQGNWGEIILERVLEKSGLVAGQEYETQASLTDDEGRRFQPDVLIKLPEGKHLVVDSKVSLIAYERCVNQEEPELVEQYLKEHLTSVKSHISELSKKSYESLYGIISPDFVLMFIPIEPAFTMAMQADDSLFDFAFRQNVVIVTPSTLLATLRTVANIWRQEKQTRNVMEIARKSGALYDKFVGFFSDMEEIGRRIGKSHEAYDEAMKKLHTGRGNLVRSVEEIKKLGARAKKDLPENVVEEALLGD